jgi:hypothetical protein
MHKIQVVIQHKLVKTVHIAVVNMKLVIKILKRSTLLDKVD